MTTIEFQEKKLSFDEEGYLIDPDDWSEDLGRYLCEKDGIYLTDRCWKVILAIRKYYMQYQMSPMPRIIIKELNKSSQGEKYAIKDLHRLFPNTPIYRLCRYAGIPQTSGCS